MPLSSIAVLIDMFFLRKNIDDPVLIILILWRCSNGWMDGETGNGRVTNALHLVFFRFARLVPYF
ncbi:hypothetical protein ACJX0J_010413, partial [Zea mays]